MLEKQLINAAINLAASIEKYTYEHSGEVALSFIYNDTRHVIMRDEPLRNPFLESVRQLYLAVEEYESANTAQ